jgi:hypothetical protein
VGIPREVAATQGEVVISFGELVSQDLVAILSEITEKKLRPQRLTVVRGRGLYSPTSGAARVMGTATERWRGCGAFS